MNLAMEGSTPCNHGTNESMYSAGISGTLGGADTNNFISLSVFYEYQDSTSYGYAFVIKKLFCSMIKCFRKVKGAQDYNRVQALAYNQSSYK